MTIKAMTVRVYHSGYGCDTGCCGHIVELNGERQYDFDFGHPDSNSDEDRKKYARAFAEEVIKKEHPECLPSIDWATLDFEDVNCD